MAYKEWYRPSASEECEIYSQCYDCEEPKAILQIAHGMAEHSGRYKEFMEYLASQGFVVCANDHLGHGRTGKGNLGVFANKPNGFDYVIEDIHLLFEEMKKEYFDLPLILLGHSMGSILSALFADRYDYLSGLILMGTPVQNPISGIAIYGLTRSVNKHGYAYESKIWNRMMWGKEPVDRKKQMKHREWLTRDEQIITDFIEDELCGVSFKDSANLELVKGLKKWGEPTWGEKIPDIPILVIAGAKDKIGGKGKGPTYYYQKLKAGHENVTLKLLPDNKHEVLNEYEKEETYEYLRNWLVESVKENA